MMRGMGSRKDKPKPNSQTLEHAASHTQARVDLGVPPEFWSIFLGGGPYNTDCVLWGRDCKKTTPLQAKANAGGNLHCADWCAHVCRHPATRY